MNIERSGSQLVRHVRRAARTTGQRDRARLILDEAFIAAGELGMNAIVAEVYKDASWLDGKECIVLDYSKTSLVAQWIRDEIRLVDPNVYLGKVYWEKKRLIDFCLEFPST